MEGTKGNTVACIITGATGAVGKAATKALAAEGWFVVMACRNMKKAEGVRKEILADYPGAKIEILEIEMSSVESVRQFVKETKVLLKEKNVNRVSLFNNSGVLPRRFELTEESVEKTFAVNYLNVKLLTSMLIDEGVIGKGCNICNMVSLTTRFAHFDETTIAKASSQKPHEYGMLERLRIYSSSKLALQRYSMDLAKKHPNLHINVSDPGIVDSNMISMGKWFDPLADLLFRPFIKTAEQGAAPALRALHSDETMKYFVGNKTITCR